MTAVAVARRRRVSALLPALLYSATILAQIAYPLTGGADRDRLTVLVVLLGAAAGVVHAAGRGALALLALAGAALIGLTSEAVGVATGYPFGDYAYAGTLGPEVMGVPCVVVAAWVFMAWPAAVVARRLAHRLPARIALGAVALAAWDVFLDPQMVTQGHWSWEPGGWRLPGIPDIPLTNFAGWLLVATLISALMQTVVLHRAADPGSAEERADRPVVVFYVWTAASSALAAGVFWGRPAVAAWGLLAMGPVAVAAARSLRTPRP